MRTIRCLIPFLLLMTASAVSFASVKNSGQIINENPSVRGAGMGYAYTSNITEDAFGIFSNPSYSAKSPIAGFSYSTIFYHGDNVSEFSTAAFSFLYPDLFCGLNIGIAAVSSLEGNLDNEQDSAVYLNLSKKIRFLKIGINAKYINSKFYRDNDSDLITADAGLSASFGIFSIGVSGYNLFGEFKGITGEKVNPSLSADASLDFSSGDFFFSLAAGGAQKDLNENKINPRAGLEIFYRFIALRGGYEYDNDLEDKGLFSAGLGVEVKGITADYAFIADQNDLNYGDIHKFALSYRFYSVPKVDNEKYKQQIAYEKQQAKIEKQELKQNKKNLKEKKATSKTSQKTKDHEYGSEFTAVLTAEELYEQKDSSLSATANEEQMEKIPAADVGSVKKNKQKTSGSKNKKKKSEKNPAAVISVEDDEFDAARYILENPGKNKIKQYYVKPTETSKDDFDAALYLLEKEKNRK